MSRLRLAIHGVTTGYLLLGATALYALGSIPVALHFLDAERFGLWALLGSLIGYLSMIDLGMSSSIGRHLIDVKDDRKGGSYGSAIKTGWIVLMAQGAVLIVIGLGGARAFSQWMEIPSHLHSDFRALVWLQCAVVAFGFCSKMFHCLLLAHQRIDIANYGGVLSLVVSFIFLCVFFILGADVYSLIFAGLAGSLACSAFQFAWCWHLALFPEKSGWGRVSFGVFKEMFRYGREVFLVALGSQLILASQTIIIVRMMGLEAAAIWTIATRTFNLMAQAVWRVSYTSFSALAEMLVRGERERLRDRYASLARLVNSLSVYSAISFALCNSSFLSFWTSGKVSWPPFYDVLLGVWLMILTWGNTNGNWVLATKRVHFMKYVYFLEGIVFVIGATISINFWGIAGMLACSIVCSIVFSGMYSAWRVSNLFDSTFREVAIGWWKNAGYVLAAFGSVAALVLWATKDYGVTQRLASGMVVSLLIGIPMFLRLGVPKILKIEFVSRIPKRFAAFIERALGCAKAEA